MKLSEASVCAFFFVCDLVSWFCVGKKAVWVTDVGEKMACFLGADFLSQR